MSTELTRKESTDLSAQEADWEKELLEEAEEAVRGVEASAKFFSTKSGVLSFDGEALPNNEMAAIVLHFALENKLYASDFQPGVFQVPTCYAFSEPGQRRGDMKPSAAIDYPVNPSCGSCPKKKWGTGANGKGRACKDSLRMVLVGAGRIDDGTFIPITEPSYYETSNLGVLNLPVTSVRAFESYVVKLKGIFQRPPYAVVTKIKVVPNPKRQYDIVFEPLSKVPAALGPVIKERRQEAMEIVKKDYPKPDESEASEPDDAPAQPKKAAKYDE